MMKLLILLAASSLGLGSCMSTGSPRGDGGCGPCDPTVTCTPQGTCVIECVGPSGSTCSVELDCSGGTCRVVRSDCPEPCASACAANCAK